MFVAIHVFSVPLIHKEVFQIELKSARLALSNTFKLTNKMYANLESFRQQALEAHKQRLKAVVELTEVHIREAYAEATRTGTDFEQARLRILDGLRNFTYDNGGYIWIADHNTNILSHPDPKVLNMDMSQPDSGEQSGIIGRLIQSAKTEGEGFYQYQWQRLHQSNPTDKLSYVKNYPEWGFIIGSGLYLDDIDREVEKRKQAIIKELHEALSEVTVGESGYVFIFDENGHIFTHPNPKHYQTSGFNLINPVTGRPILKELMEVADTGKELHYKWDKPSDPENFIYDKVSLVRSLDGLGWYICSTVYEDELRQSSVLLSERILTIALISTFIAALLAAFFINRITRPIKRLANTAERIRGGDLTAVSGISRDDEIGMLAQTFDTMVQRLHHNIQTLDDKVKVRTAELVQQEERQRLILDALPAQIAYLDRDLNYIFVNQGYADLFNRSKDEIVGRQISEIIDPQMMKSINDQIDSCLAGEKIIYEYPFQQGSKEIITKRTLIPYLTPDNQVAGILNLSLDVTAEKNAELKLMEAQRMSAAGQLAGGLAHDFNNLLTVIMGNLLAAKDHFSETDGLSRYIAPAIRASRRGADLTGRLLSFSRRQTLAPCAIKLPDLIQETIELLESSMPDTISLSYCIETERTLFADPCQLENALVNLALNAKDAMPEGGRIEIIVRECVDLSAQTYDEPVADGAYIEIQVNDTGSGFSPQAKTLAFEPFYTTKNNGEGSGLGLSMVYGFIKQSSGYISLNQRSGGGASVSLLLPIGHQRKQSTKTPAALLPEASQETERQMILLAEDDDDVRSVVRDQLLSIGYSVIEAQNADEAEQLINTLDNIDAMVTDVNMPGRLDGFELAAVMHNKHPANTVVIISGNEYAPTGGTTTQTDYSILRKPFDKETLAEALRNAKLSFSTEP